MYPKLTSRRLSLAMRRVPLRTARVVRPRQTTLSEKRWLAHFMHLDAHCSRAVVAMSPSGTRREHRLPAGGLTIDERLTPLCLLESRDCNEMSLVLIVPRRPEMRTCERKAGERAYMDVCQPGLEGRTQNKPRPEN